MDQIFGPDKFQATAVWQKVYSPRMDSKGFSEDHDYIVIYGSQVGRIPFNQNVNQFNIIDPQTNLHYRRRSLRK